MTIEKIKAAILKATGNPTSGAIAQYADVMAEAAFYAISGEEEKPSKTERADKKELRVVKADETR